jgi:hypothetical protein
MIGSEWAGTVAEASGCLPGRLGGLKSGYSIHMQPLLCLVSRDSGILLISTSIYPVGLHGKRDMLQAMWSENCYNLIDSSERSRSFLPNIDIAIPSKQHLAE